MLLFTIKQCIMYRSYNDQQWARISIRARCTTLCDKVCQWLTTGRWFSLGSPPIKLTATK